MELHLEGWMVLDHNGNIALTSEKDAPLDEGRCMAEMIIEKLHDATQQLTHKNEIVDKEAYIPNARLICWFPEEKCDPWETKDDCDWNIIFGNFKVLGHDVRYPEDTITDFRVDEFRIGTHDLNVELKPYVGKYLLWYLRKESDA